MTRVMEKTSLISLAFLLVQLILVVGERGIHFDDLKLPESFNSDISGRIWNGDNATSGQFPYQALLYMTNADGQHAFCGGSLISETYVLTAAHCCQDINNTVVFLGMVDVADATSSFVQKYYVENSDFVIHEKYDPNNISNDICLLKLPQPAELNSNVSTVALSQQVNTDPSVYDFSSATISGWGQTNNFEGLHPILQGSEVILLPHFLCVLRYVFINPVSDTQLCSSKIIYTGPCHGDSGGPLTVVNSAGQVEEIGLVSWGVGGCSSFNPTVFTYVPAYIDWIQQHMS